MKTMLRALRVSAALLASASALSVPASAAETLRVGASFITSGLDPAKGSNGWALTSHGVGETLFAVDKDGVLVPELAESAERADELVWLVKLKPGRHFSDGTAVSAETVGAGLAHTMANNKAALATGGTLRFEAVDPLTMKVTTEKPVALIQALFAEWPLVIYHLKEDGTATFSGPYAVKTFRPDAEIELEPNPHFEGADKRSPVTYRKFADSQAMTLAFEAGELDLAFGLPAESIPRLKANPELTIKDFPVGYQYLAYLNTRKPAFGDARVRRAIDLALDRDQLVLAIHGGLPATGAYAPYFPFAAKEPRTTDVAKAAELLTEAGWVAGADGKRSKDGAALKLAVLAYPQRPDLVAMLPVVKAQLAALGIEVETRIVENSNEVAGSGDFDIFLWAQHTAPTGDPAFFLNSTFRTGAGLNFSGYADPAFDAILDGFANETDPAKRAAIAAAAQAKLFEDAPVTFLVSPVWHVGLSKALAGYEPWGSDYHVLRADIGEAK
ncbi:peptide-binding protein [Kaistia sp. 32K]|uniref:ABC transporter substrate-binding protein n=1 Tax=Kaistia sp. 32K TaxID=2795690 RepID=UPI0019163F0E|nr:ABC transporter substrate-binding protein [Kaistia sp. 32K]BCP53868.1 peptide-binding protein [Kaistia sp. 32K]